MKIIFKKIASVLASATMLLSTAGFAAAATTYPSPFTSGAAVVYGVSADKSDVIAAIDIYSNLKDKTGGTVTTVVSASGGDNVNLASSSRKIYYGDAINVAKTSLTSTELPNVLSASKFTDLSGTQYSYTQTIKPGPAAVTFGTSGGDLNDPKLHIDGGDSGALTAGHLYNYTLSFSKNINVTVSCHLRPVQKSCSALIFLNTFFMVRIFEALILVSLVWYKLLLLMLIVERSILAM